MGDRLMVTVESREAALSPLLEVLKGAPVGEVRLIPAEPGLEELFVQIVRGEEG
jgi:hypothetical protein